MKTASINNIQAGIDLLEVSLTDYKIRLKDSGHLLGAEIGAELEYTISSLYVVKVIRTRSLKK